MAMVDLFSHHLNASITALALPADLARAVRSNELRLAALNVPESLDSMTAAKLKNSIDQSFVFGFRVIMFFCAGLSLASSVFAWRMIGTDKHPPEA